MKIKICELPPLNDLNLGVHGLQSRLRSWLPLATHAIWEEQTLWSLLSLPFHVQFVMFSYYHFTSNCQFVDSCMYSTPSENYRFDEMMTNTVFSNQPGISEESQAKTAEMFAKGDLYNLLEFAYKNGDFPSFFLGVPPISWSFSVVSQPWPRSFT